MAQTFIFVDESGQSLSELARLDTLVTIVDAVNFSADFDSVDELRDRNIGLDENDTRDVVKLLVDQIEFANVLVISKCDLVDEDRINHLKSLLRSLNPTARIILASQETFRFGRS